MLAHHEARRLRIKSTAQMLLSSSGPVTLRPHYSESRLSVCVYGAVMKDRMLDRMRPSIPLSLSSRKDADGGWAVQQAGRGGGRARRLVLQRRDVGPDHHGAVHAVVCVKGQQLALVGTTFSRSDRLGPDCSAPLPMRVSLQRHARCGGLRSSPAASVKQRLPTFPRCVSSDKSPE